MLFESDNQTFIFSFDALDVKEERLLVGDLSFAVLLASPSQLLLNYYLQHILLIFHLCTYISLGKYLPSYLAVYCVNQILFNPLNASVRLGSPLVFASIISFDHQLPFVFVGRIVKP